MSYRAVVVAALLVAVSAPAAAQGVNQFIGFGDSTIDSGWYKNPAFPPIGGTNFNAAFPTAVAEGAGKPTSSPGLMSSEVLASLFGVTAIPGNQPGGTNFATSGARNNLTNGPSDGLFQGAIPTVTQINNYLTANAGSANGNAIYLISSGGNDIGFANNNIIGLVNQLAYLNTAASDLVTGITTLHAAGARYIIVPNQPEDLNVTLQPLRAAYDSALWSGLSAAGVNFIPADINAVRLAIVANPLAFGFQFIGTGSPACTQPAGIGSAWALLCATSVSPLVSPNADLTHLFADDQHLATAGQKIFGDYFYSLAVAPSEISFLAETPVKTRTALIGVIQNQIAISESQRGPLGFNTWVTGDLSHLKLDNNPGFPGDPGNPAAVTAGIDLKAPNGWLYGLAITYGTTKQTFSLGGDFRQDEFAASLYAALIQGQAWLTLVGTYGTLHYDVNRVAPIGITLQSNKGSTSGDNYSLAAETGWNLVNGSTTHGPLAGLIVQRVHVGGFTESGSFTSLSYDDQTRNSAITELGYQVKFDSGIWQPFARLTWNHDWASSNRSVTAFLTTTPAPGYSMPAVVLGDNWAAATIGTTVKIGNGVKGIIALTGQTGQHAVVYGAQVGLNSAF